MAYADFRQVPTTTVGGMTLSVLTMDDAAAVMLDAARRHQRGNRPLYFTSANGEVLARVASDKQVAALFAEADQVLADGQPLVVGSRFLCSLPLPQRVATTDLFHYVARLAEQNGSTFYLFGAAEAENRRAAEIIARDYPALKVVGRSHGYLQGAELDAKLAEINALAPDIFWLAMGVPREQFFIAEHSHKLSNVGLIKTSGGLFDHIAGKTRRAPALVQKLGLEWLWRIGQEPRRLFWRYFTTNPYAALLILTRSH